MACASPAYIAATDFFLFVVVVSFIATILWIFAYLLGIREALNVAINWIFTVSVKENILNNGNKLYFLAKNYTTGLIVQKSAFVDQNFG